MAKYLKIDSLSAKKKKIRQLMYVLHIVINIDTFNAKSYPGIDAFITESFLHWRVFCKKVTLKWKCILHSVAQKLNFQPILALKVLEFGYFKSRFMIRGLNLRYININLTTGGFLSILISYKLKMETLKLLELFLLLWRTNEQDC